jgi:hypothetical protein
LTSDNAITPSEVVAERVGLAEAVAVVREFVGTVND